jgi:hypothetical protein
MSDQTSKNILATIIYYDILDYPLTSFEIWKYLLSYNMEHITYDKGDKINLADIMQELDNSELQKNVEEYRGFYFLKNRKELVEQRIERNKISEAKFKIIKKTAWLLRFAPFVRMIAVAGRMAMKNADKKSDLDLLIILKNGKIFTGRILVTLAVHLLGVRRYGNKIKNRICLNHFMTDENLETRLHDLFSSSENSQALHLFASSEYSFIYPIFGWEAFQKFQKANEWIRDYKINFEADGRGSLKILKDTRFSRMIRKTGEILFSFDFIEKSLKKWQMSRIINDPRTHQPGSFVTANDKELIFLPEPQGIEIEEKYKKMASALLTNG